ncbi:uncharacterized protein LOC131619636 [Vicia villosa]|uniref:uncharacterized protein LOC131619636 n=1 Tax=Vicia villosa TaxID=3911 RepID=UPI00273B8F68|nr:uncharacterized protein LOC131619636 [Vicia villosa]
MADFKWEVGSYFSSKDDFKEAITSYAVHSGRNLKFTKNDNVRVRVKCKDGCDWEAYCAKSSREETWQLRKVNDVHSCSRDYNVKMMTTKWLSKRLQKSLKTNPRMKIKDIKAKAQKKWNVGSTVKVGVEPSQEGSQNHLPYFKRLYICLAACKQSFKFSRHVIGLDGCFLKGLCGGQILAAIGRDPNDQMLPIAFAVVEGENRDSWTWFLELLIDDLGGKNECLTYTFMSDQQKGLLPAMDELLPNVEQRFCVRHLYNNFRKRYPGKMLKEIIWRAAKATYAQAWEREMKRMRLINEEAYLHMMKTPPRFWSRSYFRGTNKCDVVVNNLSESFNSVILEARSKPLVTVSQPAVNLSQSVSQPAVNLSQPASAQGSKTSTQPSKKSTQPSKKTTTRPAKLGVRRPTTPFVPPGPTTRLSAAKNMIGPTTRRTTPTKRTTPKKKN